MYCDNCGKRIKKDDQFCIFCGENILDKEVGVVEYPGKSNVRKRNIKSIKFVVFGLVAVIVLLLVSRYVNGLNNVQNNSSQSQQPLEEIDNTKTVVQIACDSGFFGSGIVFSDDGVIITNNHVLEGASSCLVTIPNEDTGEVSEMYEAQPLFIPKLSNLYDIAMLVITGAYVDEDGTTWGTYPNTFTYLQRPLSCTDRPSKLGDGVRIYGYPSTSHNYNLTVTEGIISNFDDGYILTSAKIDSGNSGGLAIDYEGCFIGIPSAVIEGDFQNLGVIIPSSIVFEFFDESDEIEPVFESDSSPIPSTTNTSLEPTKGIESVIDCVGPDGKHMSITQKECDDFNNAWKPRATIAPQNSNQNSPCGANQYYSYGSCYCNDGYSKNYSTGLCDPCPANSTGSYGSCTCNNGYSKNYATGLCELCPPNSSGSYGVCTCNNGYTKNYSTGLCEPCPVNSTGLYGSCLCNSGYTKDYSSGQCIKN